MERNRQNSKNVKICLNNVRKYATNVINHAKDNDKIRKHAMKVINDSKDNDRLRKHATNIFNDRKNNDTPTMQKM